MRSPHVGGTARGVAETTALAASHGEVRSEVPRARARAPKSIGRGSRFSVWRSEFDSPELRCFTYNSPALDGLSVGRRRPGRSHPQELASAGLSFARAPPRRG